MYKIRIPIGIALISIVFFLGYIDYSTTTVYATSSILALAALVALWEFYSMAKNRDCQPYVYSGLGCSFLFLLWTIHPVWQIDITGIFLVMICVRFLFDAQKENAVENCAITIFGYIYITYLLSYAIKIRGLHHELNHNLDGLYYLVFLIFVAKGMDIGGYLVGKAFGKHKIIPIISPNKSYEGAVGGILFSIGTGYLFYLYIPIIHQSLSPIKIIVFAIIMSILSLMGDLVESLIKRRCNVKDSNQLIPEFGGILDLVDSLLLTAPIGYYYLLILAS